MIYIKAYLIKINDLRRLTKVTINYPTSSCSGFVFKLKVLCGFCIFFLFAGEKNICSPLISLIACCQSFLKSCICVGSEVNFWKWLHFNLIHF